MMRIASFLFLVCFLMCCGCNTLTTNPTIHTVPIAPEPTTELAETTQSTETQPTEAIFPTSIPAPETAPTEAESTEPAETEPVELTFESYEPGTTGLRSITSDQGVTLTVDKNYYFEFPKEYKGIIFSAREEAKIRHFDYKIKFEVSGGSIEKIEILGSDRKTRIGPDGELIEPIYDSTVPGQYRLEIGYRFLRIFGITEQGKEFQIILIAGTH